MLATPPNPTPTQKHKTPEKSNHDLESEGQDTLSPSKRITLRKKPIPQHLTLKRQTAKNTPSPPPIPHFTRETTPDVVATTSSETLPMAFSKMQAPSEALTLELPPSPAKETNKVNQEMEMET